MLVENFAGQGGGRRQAGAYQGQQRSYAEFYATDDTDYDIYIGDRCPDVEKVMLALGYVYDHDTENDMDFIKKPSLHFEMHHSLFTDKYDFGGYFNMIKTVKNDLQYDKEELP